MDKFEADSAADARSELREKLAEAQRVIEAAQRLHAGVSPEPPGCWCCPPGFEADLKMVREWKP